MDNSNRDEIILMIIKRLRGAMACRSLQDMCEGDEEIKKARWAERELLSDALTLLHGEQHKKNP